MNYSPIALDPRYHGPLAWSVIVQLALLPAGTLAVDGGEVMRSVSVASAAFWATVLMMACRRPSRPTALDLLLLRHGLLVLALMCWVGMWGIAPSFR